MATNPMQRKARNSFLLGMLIMLLISGVIIALLGFMLMSKIRADQQTESNMKNVYVLKQDVKSGEVITNNMLEKKSIDGSILPSNATSDLTTIDDYRLQDKDGNVIQAVYDEASDSNRLYIEINGTRYEAFKDEEDPQEIYIIQNGQNVYLDLDSVPLIAKVNMGRNTVITTDLLAKGNNVVQNDVREQEYNVIVLPVDLTTGDYVDIRLMLPNGQDFIVVSKKEVTIPQIGGVDSVDTIKMNLSEDETIHMSAAIMDVAKVNGAKLYATKYTDPGMQEKAEPTYIVGNEAIQILQRDPNIVESAMSEIRSRYQQMNSDSMRNEYIQSAINDQGDQAQTNLETTIEESITKSQEARQDYLDSLSSSAAATTTTTTTTTTNTTSN